MQQTSELWQTMWRDPNHEEEVRVDIAGVSYAHDRIVSVEVSGGIFETLDIGNCVSRQLDLVLYPSETIPKQAKMQVFLRLSLDGQTSEWIPQGEFFISTRSTNQVDGTLTIHGFDAMRKAGQVWLTPEYDYDNWPKSEWESVRDIAGRMGVEIDSRTVLSNTFPVDYPVNENGDMTMTDVLEGIAVANSGNWVISEAGKLLLLRIGDIPPETNYLVSEYGDAILFGGDRILVG